MRNDHVPAWILSNPLMSRFQLILAMFASNHEVESIRLTVTVEFDDGAFNGGGGFDDIFRLVYADVKFEVK